VLDLELCREVNGIDLPCGRIELIFCAPVDENYVFTQEERAGRSSVGAELRPLDAQRPQALLQMRAYLIFTCTGGLIDAAEMTDPDSHQRFGFEVSLHV